MQNCLLNAVPPGKLTLAPSGSLRHIRWSRIAELVNLYSDYCTVKEGGSSNTSFTSLELRTAALSSLEFRVGIWIKNSRQIIDLLPATLPPFQTYLSENLPPAPFVEYSVNDTPAGASLVECLHGLDRLFTALMLYYRLTAKKQRGGLLVLDADSDKRSLSIFPNGVKRPKSARAPSELFRHHFNNLLFDLSVLQRLAPPGTVPASKNDVITTVPVMNGPGERKSVQVKVAASDTQPSDHLDESQPVLEKQPTFGGLVLRLRSQFLSKRWKRVDYLVRRFSRKHLGNPLSISLTDLTTATEHFREKRIELMRARSACTLLEVPMTYQDVPVTAYPVDNDTPLAKALIFYIEELDRLAFAIQAMNTLYGNTVRIELNTSYLHECLRQTKRLLYGLIYGSRDT